MPPPPFLWQGKSVVPVEFLHYELTLSVDVGQRRAVGLARISFSASQQGLPLQDAKADVDVARANKNGYANAAPVLFITPQPSPDFSQQRF